jgi:hypothetical protein
MIVPDEEGCPGHRSDDEHEDDELLQAGQHAPCYQPTCVRPE